MTLHPLGHDLFFGLLPPWIDAILAVGGVLLILIPIRRHGPARSVGLAYLLGGGLILAAAVIVLAGYGVHRDLYIATVTGLVLVVAGVVRLSAEHRSDNPTPGI